MSDYTNYKYISNDVVIYNGGLFKSNYSKSERRSNGGKRRPLTKSDEYTVTLVYKTDWDETMFLIWGLDIPVNAKYFTPKIVDGKRVKDWTKNPDSIIMELYGIRDTRVDEVGEMMAEMEARKEEERLIKEAHKEVKRQERLERRAQRRSERGESVYINDKGVMSGESDKSKTTEKTRSEPKTYSSTKEDKVQVYTQLMNEAAENEEYDLAIQYRDKINKIESLKNKMKLASENLDFELAIKCREEISKI